MAVGMAVSRKAAMDFYQVAVKQFFNYTTQSAHR
jgi:hypothetical protein